MKMKKFFSVLFIFFIFSCREKKEFYKIEKKEKIKVEEKSNVEKVEEKDPLLNAMLLLIEYKKDPENLELKMKVCEEFKKLKEDAIGRGNYEMAEKYAQIASICEEKKFETISEQRPEQESYNGLAVSSSNFEIKISGASRAAQAERILYILDNAFMQISSELSFIPERKIVVILYTDKEFYDTTKLPNWVGGAYDGRIHLPLANANYEDPVFKKVIIHELAHAILHEISNGRAPAWVQEGIAQYFDGKEIENKGEILRAIKEKRIPPLDSKSFIIYGSKDSELLYNTSLLCVNFLKERSSMGAISEFLKKIGEGKKIEEAFFEVFLFPYEELTERVKEYLEKGK